MDEAARLREEIRNRDAIIASMQARISQLQAQWDEIYEAGQRSVMAAVPPQAHRRNEIGLRVIRGGLGAGLALALARLAQRALRGHPLTSAALALTALLGTGVSVPVMLAPGQGPAVTLTSPARGNRGPSGAPLHEERARGRRPSALPSATGHRAAPRGTAGAAPSGSRGPRASGSPSPSPSRSPSPSPSVSAPVTVTPSPSPSQAPQCTVYVLGLCLIL